MSVAAYRQSIMDTATPRQLERKVFQQVTMDLETATRSNDAMARIRAIDRNRRLWITLIADVSDTGNLLPDALKAGLISLGLWVDRYSGQALSTDHPLSPLVDVNRAVMQGLGPAPAR
ncbi:flagellar biosynthesis regulator FlaF [Niveispirillum fermenti]|uniref:flagellar biosynthesis regulator FlaF n=1 Tax=Niveispirillum fermenti TaxID=1233113 RepID=UPI003A8A77AB